MPVQSGGKQVFSGGGRVNNYANSGTENCRILYICLYTVLYKFIANCTKNTLLLSRLMVYYVQTRRCKLPI